MDSDTARSSLLAIIEGIMEGNLSGRKIIRHTLQGTSICLSLWLQFIMKENMLVWLDEVINEGIDVLTRENIAMYQKAKEWILETKQNEKTADSQRAQESSSLMQALDSDKKREWKTETL